MTKRIHFPLTTAQQRRLLFETWQASGNVTLACRTAHVGRRTFFEQQVIAMRQTHPEWGKVRIAHELAKAHQWQPLVSPNTVKRILRSAGLWPAPAASEKKGASQPSLARPKKAAKP